MNFSKKIKRLERKGIVSRKPHPAIPFILAFIALILGILTPDKTFSYAFFLLAGFSFLFAVLHLIVVRTLKR
jgi:hypothetical protein